VVVATWIRHGCSLSLVSGFVVSLFLAIKKGASVVVV
jgi:hypothetical protein